VRPSGRVPRFFGVLVALAGVLNLVSALLPPLRTRVRSLEPLVGLRDIELASVLAVQAGLLLLFVARQLARGKRRAWQFAIVILLASAGFHIAKGLDVEEAVLTGGLAVTLFFYRDRFRAASDKPSFNRLLRAVPLLAMAPFVYGIAGLFIRRHAITGGFSFTTAVVEVANRLIWLTGPVHYETRFFGTWFPLSISLMGVLLLGYAVFLTFRPVVYHGTALSIEEEADVRSLVLADFGTLSYFMLRDDKQIFMSPDRRAAIGYRLVGGVALISGDPVGERTLWSELIRSFSTFAHDHGWSLAALGVSEDVSQTFADLGCRLVYMGDEAIVDPRTFSLEGRHMGKVRNSMSKVERAGYTLEWHRSGDLTPDLRDALLRVSSDWREGDEERGFSMTLGRLFDPRDPDCLVAIGRDASGHVGAFLHFVPAGPRGYSLDVMRRVAGAPGGVNEWLIARTLEHLGQQDVCEVSLNFAFMRGIIRPATEPGPYGRLKRWLLIKMGPWFQIESLYRFNNKFGPTWRRRYGACEDRVALPGVVVAALRAENLFDLSTLRHGQRGKRGSLTRV